MDFSSFPAAALIRLGKLTWTTVWQGMMAQLAPSDRTGHYLRPPSAFRHRISRDPSGRYSPAADRYQLIVGLACPWAHRTLVVRAIKGLEAAISVAIVAPDDTGIWTFDRPFLGCDRLPQLYQRAQPGYAGRATVPVLFDRHTQTIVNNESAEVIESLNSEFNEFSRFPDLDLYPSDLTETIEEWNEKIYAKINNGVYRCGFAQSQEAYNLACRELFATLDEIEEVLGDRQYLCGDRLTLADVRLFTTLVRFDLVYYGLFKCNLRRLQDFPHLSRYARDLYHLPGVAQTCDFDTIKQHYYGALFPLNPGGIVPLGPDLDWQ